MAKHVVFTIQGTAAGMWLTAPPQPAYVGSTLAAQEPDLFFWQPVGDYPAATFPMGPSVTDGVNSLIYMLTGEPVPGSNTTVPGPVYTNESFMLVGYSQGALVVCQFVQWCFANNRQDVLERLVAVAVWGNPQRMPGFASGNEFAGWPLPGLKDGQVTGGIAGPLLNMTEEMLQPQLKTPVTHYWFDLVNTNCPDLGNTELYANCPVGSGEPEAAVGAVETSIYNAVQNFTLATAMGVIADLETPIAMAEAILNGFEFLGAAGNADHYTYDVQPAIDFLKLCAAETPPFTV